MLSLAAADGKTRNSGTIAAATYESFYPLSRLPTVKSGGSRITKSLSALQKEGKVTGER